MNLVLPPQPLPTPWTYLWRHTILAWVPSVFIWHAVIRFYPGVSEFDVFTTPVSALLIGCILAPYLETQGMRLVLYVLGIFVKNDRRITLYSAALWGGLHIQSESWGLHAFWAFYIFTRCYLEQAKYSIRRAVWMTTAIHAACNLLSYAYTLTEHYLS